jgi:hypothetical protein
MLLRTYIDDSADQTQERVMLAGAFMGWYHQWSGIRKTWKKRLKQDGLTFFHSTECRSLQGEFSKFRDVSKYPKPLGRQAADRVRDDLDAIIHGSGVMGMACCVPMKVYKEIRQTVTNAAEILPKDAYELALKCVFTLCAETAMKEMKDIGPQRVAFICDQSSYAPRISKMYDEFSKQNKVYEGVIEGLVHQDDKKHPPLQAADLMAHLAKDRFSDWLDDPAIFTNKPEMKKRLQQLSVYAITICNEEWLLNLVDLERKRRGL